MWNNYMNRTPAYQADVQNSLPNSSSKPKTEEMGVNVNTSHVISVKSHIKLEGRYYLNFIREKKITVMPRETIYRAITRHGINDREIIQFEPGSNSVSKPKSPRQQNCCPGAPE